MQAQTQTTRTLTVSPDIIMSLIEAQAGSLAKGFLECVMNSSDGGATKVEITMDSKTVSIVDDGKGFESREEILACFEVFGFKHKDIKEKFARFGMGRAQLWSFMSNVWRTNGFEMDVNIKERGLDYDLRENVTPATKGLRIDGTFYEPQKTADILEARNMLAELVLFMNIPVFFNGERINKDASTMKWTHQTDDAWISLNENMRELTVFNLGAKVCSFPSSRFGVGGVVVTKPGVRLQLNMARNDILLAQCEVWRRIRPFLQAKSDESVARTKRPSESQLANIAERIRSGEIAGESVDQYKLIVDVQGGRYTISEFISRAYAGLSREVTYVSKREAGPLAEKTHSLKHSFVLDQKTLHRFGLATVGTLLEALKEVARGLDPHMHQMAAGLVAVEKWRDACKRLSSEHIEVPHKEWSKREQAGIASLKSVNRFFPNLLRGCGASSGQHPRQLRLGQSETASAWTDGKGVIWVNRSLLAGLEIGLPGVMRLINVMVHEYLHDEETSGSHVHDENFHKRFHNAMLFTPTPGNYGPSVGDIAIYLLKDYAKQLDSRGEKVKARFLASSSASEEFAILEE